MKNKLRLRQNLKTLLNTKQPQIQLIPGELGAVIDDGTKIKVPNRDGFVYVRVRGKTSEIIQAFNDKVNNIYGLPVLLERDPESKIYRVYSRNLQRYDEWGGSSGYSQLAQHGAQHSFGSGYGSGNDVVWVYKRQFMPLLLHPHTGTIVKVEPEWYLWGEDYNHFTGSYVNVSGSIPVLTDEARFITIYLDGSTNTLKAVTGSAFNAYNYPANVDDYVPVVHYSAGIPVGAILLSHGMTRINWNSLYDIRPLFAGYPGGASAGGLLIYDDGVFKVTGTAISFDENLFVFTTGSTAFIRGRTPEIVIYDDNIYKITGTAISFQAGLRVTVTGTTAYVDFTGTYGHVIKDDGVAQTTRANLDFVGTGFVLYDDAINNSTIVSGTASGSGGGGTIGGTGSVTVFDDGALKGQVTQLNFEAGINATVTGSMAFINLSLTGTSTYMLVGVPSCLDNGVTGTYWQVPSQVYATGSLSIFINGVSQIVGIDYNFQHPSSGTYQLLATPPTGSVHFAIWGVPVPEGAGESYRIDNSIMNCRLSLTSGTAVTTTDIYSGTSLWLNPYLGNKVTLYNGADWDKSSFAPLRLDVSSLASGTVHDIFLYNNVGTLTLEAVAWTNTTTRATDLAYQNGVYVKSGTPANRYVGTIFCSNYGRVDDATLKRFVWNYYNRRVRPIMFQEITSHTYNGSARKWNNSNANNLGEYVIGAVEDTVRISLRSSLKSAASNVYAAVTPYINGAVIAGNDTSYLGVTYVAYQAYLGIPYEIFTSSGYSYIQVYETANSTATFYAMRTEISILG